MPLPGEGENPPPHLLRWAPFKKFVFAPPEGFNLDSVSQIPLENAAIVREVLRGKRGDETSCFGQHRGRLGHGRSGGGPAGPPSLARESIDSGWRSPR